MTKKETVGERIARLAAGKAETEVSLENLKKGEPAKARGTHGGARTGSGRKPLEEQRHAQFQLVREFADKQLNVIEKDRKGKETKRKVSVLEFTLETLLTKVKEKDMSAIHEMLDRILGKAAQPIQGDEDSPIVVKIDF